MRAGVLLALVVACSGGAAPAPGPAGGDPKSSSHSHRTKDYTAEIDAMASELIAGEWMAGLSIGLVYDDSVHYFGYGRAGGDVSGAPDADTLFEIGSATKVFTALALADAVGRLGLELDDPAQKHAPKGRRIRSHAAGQFTLAQLASHTSGLPRMPENFHPKNPKNPYADYTADDMYAFLSSTAPPRPPGARYAYSNLGMGLLGELLANANGSSYEQLVVDRIAKPLGMQRTFISIPEEDANVAAGHDGEGTPVPRWDIPALAGAGALRSTTRDMITFVRANLAADHEVLGPAIAATHEPRADVESPRGKIALGWHITPDGVLWHNGQTGGFHSFIAFDPGADIAVVVLTNTATPVGDELGQSLVRMLEGKPYTLDLPKTVQLSEEMLARYVGTYELAKDFVISISREDDRLFAQATGWPGFRLYARSETEFYLRIIDATIVFEVADGAVTGMILRQGGQEFRGSRL